MEDAVKLQKLFQVLADVNRLKIIKLIGENDCSVSEIVNDIGLSQPLVSHHLKVLREQNILESSRKGPFVHYRIQDQNIVCALGLFLEIFNLSNHEETDLPMFSVPKWWK